MSAQPYAGAGGAHPAARGTRPARACSAAWTRAARTACCGRCGRRARSGSRAGAAGPLPAVSASPCAACAAARLLHTAPAQPASSAMLRDASLHEMARLPTQRGLRAGASRLECGGAPEHLRQRLQLRDLILAEVKQRKGAQERLHEPWSVSALRRHQNRKRQTGESATPRAPRRRAEGTGRAARAARCPRPPPPLGRRPAVAPGRPCRGSTTPMRLEQRDLPAAIKGGRGAAGAGARTLHCSSRMLLCTSLAQHARPAPRGGREGGTHTRCCRARLAMSARRCLYAVSRCPCAAGAAVSAAARSGEQPGQGGAQTRACAASVTGTHRVVG